jgi:hypothetical protein
MSESLNKIHAGGRMGSQGIRLKRFEEITADLLKYCKPAYSKLPVFSDSHARDIISSSIQINPIFKQKIDAEINNALEEGVPASEWPFSAMPFHAGVRRNKNNTSHMAGKLPGMRAVKKEWQLKSLIQCTLAMLPLSAFGTPDGSEEGKKIRIVDFAG